MGQTIQEIIFRTKAELSGAQQQLDMTDKQIGRLKALQTTGAATEKQLAQLSALQGQRGKLAEAVAASTPQVLPNIVPPDEHQDQGDGRGKGIKSLIYNLKALKKGAHDIPGPLGQAIMVLRHPVAIIGAAIGLAASAFMKWRETVKETKEYEYAKKGIGELDLSLAGLKESIRLAREEYAKQREQVVKSAQDEAYAISHLIELMRTRIDAQEKLREAIRKTMLVELEHKKANLEISEPDYKVQKDRLEKEQQKESVAFGKTKRARELELLQGEMTRLQSESYYAHAQLSSDEEAMEARKLEEHFLGEEKKTAGKIIDATKARIEKKFGIKPDADVIKNLRAKIPKLREKYGGGMFETGAEDPSTLGGGKIAEAQSLLNDLLQGSVRYRRIDTELQSKEPEKAFAASDAKVKELDAALARLETKIRELELSNREQNAIEGVGTGGVIQRLDTLIQIMDR